MYDHDHDNDDHDDHFDHDDHDDHDGDDEDDDDDDDEEEEEDDDDDVDGDGDDEMMMVMVMMRVRVRVRMIMIGPGPRTTLCASLRSRNACQDFTRATLYMNLTEKCRAKECGHPLCASLHSRNACQDLTKATLSGNFQEKHPDQAPAFTTTVRTPQCGHTAWGKIRQSPFLKGKSTINGPFSLAMLNSQSNCIH